MASPDIMDHKNEKFLFHTVLNQLLCTWCIMFLVYETKFTVGKSKRWSSSNTNVFIFEEYFWLYLWWSIVGGRTRHLGRWNSPPRHICIRHWFT